MGLVVYLCKMLEIKVRVNLSSADIGVAEHLLDAPQVAGGLKYMSRETVTEQMWIDLFRQSGSR